MLIYQHIRASDDTDPRTLYMHKLLHVFRCSISRCHGKKEQMVWCVLLVERGFQKNNRLVCKTDITEKTLNIDKLYITYLT